jgi:hypothetical protein
MEFLTWLENLPFSVWVRESGSLWAYPSILFLHTIGLGILVGINAAIDLRLIGFAPRLPVKPMEKLFPWIWVGFWISGISGVVLLMADATTKMTNPVFYMKMASVALAVVVLVLLRRTVFEDPALDAKPVTPTGKFLGLFSLMLWTAAVTAGRLTAYVGPVSGLPGFTNAIGR